MWFMLPSPNAQTAVENPMHHIPRHVGNTRPARTHGSKPVPVVQPPVSGKPIVVDGQSPQRTQTDSRRNPTTDAYVDAYGLPQDGHEY